MSMIMDVAYVLRECEYGRAYVLSENEYGCAFVHVCANKRMHVWAHFGPSIFVIRAFGVTIGFDPGPWAGGG